MVGIASEKISYLILEYINSPAMEITRDFVIFDILKCPKTWEIFVVERVETSCCWLIYCEMHYYCILKFTVRYRHIYLVVIDVISIVRICSGANGLNVADVHLYVNILYYSLKLYKIF